MQETQKNADLTLSFTDRLLLRLQSLIEPLLVEMGLELIEIQYRRESHGWVLRFFLDKEGGVGVDDCADASRQIGTVLEVEDPFDHPYFLEVSSPGLERPLKKKEDFVRFAGRRARIKLHHPLENGQRVLIGVLHGLEEDQVVFSCEEESTKKIRLAMENISKARLNL